MTNELEAIKARTRALAARAAQTIQLADAGAIAGAEITEMVAEMDTFLAAAATGLLDLADRAAAAGDHRRGEELYWAAMQIEEELLRSAPPVMVRA